MSTDVVNMELKQKLSCSIVIIIYWVHDISYQVQLNVFLSLGGVKYPQLLDEMLSHVPSPFIATNIDCTDSTKYTQC